MTGAAVLTYAPSGSGSFTLAATLSPSSLIQAGTTSFIETSGSVTVTPTGGTPPYAYFWEPAPYNTDDIAVSSPTSGTTKFRRSGCASGDSYFGDFFCHVGDAAGSEVEVGYVSIEIERS